MITRIHSASVAVSDQDAALEFYTDTLGWEKRIDNPMGESRFVTVAPKGSETELALLDQRMMAQGNGLAIAPGMNLGINIVCKDMQKTCDDLMAKGVTFPMPLTTMPWGALGAHFADPDGNVFFLTEDEE